MIEFKHSDHVNNHSTVNTVVAYKEINLTEEWHATIVSLIFKSHLLFLLSLQGHVDFSYEVSRSISACQGVLLIIDANQVQRTLHIYSSQFSLLNYCGL